METTLGLLTHVPAWESESHTAASCCATSPIFRKCKNRFPLLLHVPHAVLQTPHHVVACLSMMLEPFWPSPSSTVIHRGAPLESISVSSHPRPNTALHWSSEGGNAPPRPREVFLQPLESLLSLTVAQDLMKREITHQNQGWSAGVSANTLSTPL